MKREILVKLTLDEDPSKQQAANLSKLGEFALTLLRIPFPGIVLVEVIEGVIHITVTPSEED